MMIGRIAVITGVVVALGLFSAGSLYAYDRSHREKISPGVSADGIDLSGLTLQEARDVLRQRLAAPLLQPIVARRDARGYVLDPRVAGVRLDVDGLAREALARSRGGSFFGRVWREMRDHTLDVNLPVRVTYSSAVVDRFVGHIAKDLDRPARQASVRPRPDGLDIVDERRGIAVRARLLRAAIVRGLESRGAKRLLRVPMKPVLPRVTRAQLERRYPAYIIVNRSDFELHLYVHLHPTHTYNIAVGRSGLETPAGLYDVQWKEVNPPWRVPKSAWAGALAGRTIPPGPKDPIKARWLAFNGGAGIHGTDEVSSIGSAASHGCIRMRIPDVIQLYSLTPVHSPVFVV